MLSCKACCKLYEARCAKRGQNDPVPTVAELGCLLWLAAGLVRFQRVQLSHYLWSLCDERWAVYLDWLQTSGGWHTGIRPKQFGCAGLAAPRALLRPHPHNTTGPPEWIES